MKNDTVISASIVLASIVTSVTLLRFASRKCVLNGHRSQPATHGIKHNLAMRTQLTSKLLIRQRNMRPDKHFGQRRQGGFTLIELMVAIGILAIVLSIGVPSYRGIVMDNRMASQANLFATSIKLARSNAVRFQRNATVCSSANFDAAVPTCSSSNDWSGGWIVWVDKDRDAATDANEIVSVFGPIHQASELKSTSANRFTYDGRGFAATAAGELTLCDSRSGEMGRVIKVNATGRTNIARQACT